jgi:hypothetical protein
MPIIIPSKHIYGDPKIDRVNKNAIDSIEIKIFSPKMIYESYKNAYNHEKEGLSYWFGNADEDYSYKSHDTQRYDGIYFDHVEQALSFTYFRPMYADVSFSVPFYNNLDEIKRIYKGKDTDGAYRIGATFEGKLEKGLLDFDVHFEEALLDKDFAEDSSLMIRNVVYKNETTETAHGYIPTTELVDYIAESSEDAKAVSNVTVNLLTRGETVEESNESSSFQVKIKNLYCGCAIQRMGAVRRADYYKNGELKEEHLLDKFGEYERFTPKNATLSINGDIIRLDLEEKTLTFGSGATSFQVEGNELMQETNFFVGDETSSYAELYAEKILEKHEKPKGSAEINCSIFPVLVGALQTDFLTYDKTINGIFVSKSGNSLVLNGTALDKTSILVSQPSLKKDRYFLEIPTQSGIGYALFHGEYGTTAVYGDKDVYVDLKDYEDVGIYVNIEKGTKLENYIVGDIVSHESLVIPIGSSVIPMYVSENGQDKPIFTNPNGTPRPCLVVGTNVYYDGSTMQRLTVKEM